jgi:hypothetical protein
MTDSTLTDVILRLQVHVPLNNAFVKAYIPTTAQHPNSFSVQGQYVIAHVNT